MIPDTLGANLEHKGPWHRLAVGLLEVCLMSVVAVVLVCCVRPESALPVVNVEIQIFPVFIDTSPFSMVGLPGHATCCMIVG